MGLKNENIDKVNSVSKEYKMGNQIVKAANNLI